MILISQVPVSYIPELYSTLVSKAKDGSLIVAKTSVIEDVNTHVNLNVSVCQHLFFYNFNFCSSAAVIYQHSLISLPLFSLHGTATPW